MKIGKFVVGPGLGLATVASIGIFIWAPRPIDEPSNIHAARERAKAAVAPPPLVKPEPHLLLARDLSAEQREAIQQVDQAWRTLRADLELEMRQHAASMPKRPGSVEGIRAGLQGYSELSARYDQARERAWQEALAIAEASR